MATTNYKLDLNSQSYKEKERVKAEKKNTPVTAYIDDECIGSGIIE